MAAMPKQRGGSDLWLLMVIICCLGFSFMSSYHAAAAPYADVQALIRDADQNATARRWLSEALGEQPTPSRSDLAEFRKHVDSILVTDLALQIGSVQVEAREKSLTDEDRQRVQTINRLLFIGGLIISILLCFQIGRAIVR